MDKNASHETLIEIKNLRNFIGGNWVHDGLDLTVNKEEIIAIIGPSGGGKTTLMKSILRLQKPISGEIHVFGVDVVNCTEEEAQKIRRRWGVLFQTGALFSSLSVLENVTFPLNEFYNLPKSLQEEIAMLKIASAGLELEAANKHPTELSGGMQKRAALARAIVLDPELVFLDEPTTGLDPKGAGAMDDLILHLRDSLGLTIVMITHDLDTLWRVPDRVVFLGEGKILASMPMSKLVHQKNPLIKDYLSGPRGYDRGRVETSDGH